MRLLPDYQFKEGKQYQWGHFHSGGSFDTTRSSDCQFYGLSVSIFIPVVCFFNNRSWSFLGSAFCIFFGKTQPYSAVNHIGKVTTGLEIFKSVVAGDRIVLTRR